MPALLPLYGWIKRISKMNNVRFTYLRDKNNVAFGCVAVSLDRVKNTISYGLSVCHSKEDTYDRHYGRGKAQGRLNQEPNVIKFVRLDQCSAHDITRHVMFDIYSNRDIHASDAYGELTLHGAPQAARNCAKAWLKNYASDKEVVLEGASYFEYANLDDAYDDEDLDEAFDRGERAWIDTFTPGAKRTSSRVG
jgi:hypothetical protein